ncbi:MAG: GerMN domain-containing protein [Actinomycetota bacterium]
MSVRRWLISLLAASVVLGGCGVTAEDEPELIAGDEVPGDLLDPSSTTSTPREGATAAITVYLLQRTGSATQLVPVTREVEDPARPGERIEALLQPTSEDEKSTGLTSSIPADTVLLGTPTLDPERQELTLNFSEELFSVEGSELSQAFAQIVWTVTELEGVRRVRFLIEGEAQRAPDADGVEQDGAVSTADYWSLRPR